MCLPFIYRAAKDVGSKTINEEMMTEAAKTIANLARF